MSNTENKENTEELNDDTVAANDEQVINDIDSQAVNEPTIESLQAELDAQQTQFTDQLLRTKAEMENVRRRTDKQISDNRKYANDGIARELINVRDSLQIASDTEIEGTDSDAVKSMREGLELTLKQLDSLFEKFSIVEIAPQSGDKVDPHLHQAMAMIPSDEVEPGTIVNTIQRGYQLHDRLLRAAMVVVAQK
jgi:molecular chaperone GrpE